MAEKHLEVSETVAADPAVLYDMVADLTKMGDWSPENRGGRWLGGASGPARGAKFRGNNRSGWRRWQTLAEVTEADPGARFAFHVTVTGVPIADWTYEFKAVEGGTIVTEKWADRRPGWMDKLSGVVMGVADRAAHNEANMKVTLATLKSAAEARSD
jgi:hypothetical protein